MYFSHKWFDCGGEKEKIIDLYKSRQCKCKAIKDSSKYIFPIIPLMILGQFKWLLPDQSRVHSQGRTIPAVTSYNLTRFECKTFIQWHSQGFTKRGVLVEGDRGPSRLGAAGFAQRWQTRDVRPAWDVPSLLPRFTNEYAATKINAANT